MNQSKLESFIEQVLNVGSGFVLSLLIWTLVISPYYGILVSTSENIQITFVFTFVSVLRGYIWRRLFNGRIVHKVVDLFKTD